MDLPPDLLAILDRVTDPAARAFVDAAAAVHAISVLVAGEVTDDDIDDIDMHASTALGALAELHAELQTRRPA